MKKTNLLFMLLAVLMSMVSNKVYAYDIALENEDGVMIYYNYTNDGRKLEVTYRSTGFRSYSGTVVIPEMVTYQNTTRKVTSIGEQAFRNCGDLISVSIPESVTSIGVGAFMNSSLTSVIIPNSVTSIGRGAFSFNYNLTSINIPEGLTFIDTGVFNSCHSLASIDIPNKVTDIGKQAFYQCYALTSVTIPNSVTEIGESAFAECTGLTSLVIPNSVTYIGNSAFAECTALPSLVIPNSVTEIGMAAFKGCKALEKIISEIESPCEITGKSDTKNTTFDLDVFNKVTLYVPVGTVNKYKATRGWKDFAHIEEMEEQGGGDDEFIAPDFCTRTTDEICAFFEAPVTWTSTIKCWAWSTSPADNFTGGNWPGAECQLVGTADNGSKVWKWTWDRKKQNNSIALQPEGIIFSNDGAPQTDDLIFVNGGYYTNKKGLRGIVPVNDSGETPKCATPTIYYTDGKLSYKSETEGVTFISTITDSDINTYSEEEVQLTVTYHISVYATKEGYQISDVAEATLCWIEVDPQKEGITEETATDAKQLKAMPVLIQAADGQISVEGAPEGTKVAVYDASGVEMGTAISRGGTTIVPAHIAKGNIAIVKIGEKAVKLAVK